MNRTLRTIFVLVFVAALVGAVTSGSAFAQTDNRNAKTENIADGDQNNDAK